MLAAQPLVRSLLAVFLWAAASTRAQPSQGELASELDWSLREALVEATCSVTPEEGAVLEAPNPAQGMAISFASDGVRVRGTDEARGAWRLSLALDAWGREGALLPVEPAAPVADGRRVEYRRGVLTEWYVNDARGLEQGFTLDERPAGEGSLEIVLAIGAGFTAEVEPGERDALFIDRVHGGVLHYTGLLARDAAGQVLGASLALEDGRLSIRVDDDGALYPVCVDPWIATEEAKLVAGDPGSDNFGSAVDLEGDTAVIGAELEDTGGPSAGAAYVFVRSGTTWIEQQKLVASDAKSSDFFGEDVAISGDTILVGTSNAEGVYVFVRSGTTWIEQQKLVGSGTSSTDFFGRSVALSGDTALVGAMSRGQHERRSGLRVRPQRDHVDRTAEAPRRR